MAMKLNDDLNATRGVTTFRIPLDKVKVKAGFNTRFDKPPKDKYDRLKELVRAEGQRVPAEVLVLPDKTVQIADGHQRYEILCDLEREDPQGRTLLCIPFQGNEDDAKLRSITTNLGNTGLTVMDNVINWDYLINKLGKPVSEVASMYKVSQATITEGLKLLMLDKKHQKMVHEGKLSQSLALRLVKYPVKQRDALMEEMERVRAERVAKAERDLDELESGKYEAPVPEAPSNVVSMPVPSSPNREEQEIKDERAVEALKQAARRANAAEPPKPKTRTVKTATEADLHKAVENLGAQTGNEPPRKLKEVQRFFEEFMEGTPACAAVELVKDLQRFIARKLTEQQMENRLMKHTKSVLGEVLNEPKKPAKGGKK